MIVHDVEQRSEEWYKLRAGIPTASDFSRLVTSKGELSKQIVKYAYQLAADRYAGASVDAWEGNEHTERGREQEESALELYAFTHRVELARVGFVTDDDETMGCSPDALVCDEPGLPGKGLVEVKCKKADRHLEAIAYFDANGRVMPEHVIQVQGQMLICEREWCDVVYHHAVLPPLTIRVEADAKLQGAIVRAVELASAERDKAFAMIQKYSGELSEKEAAKVKASSAVDLSTAKSAF